MLTVEIPGYGLLALENLVLDLNGTLCQDGEVLAGVAEAVEALAPALRIVVVTADTHGTADELMASLAVDHVHIIDRGREAEGKLDLVDELGGDTVVAIGNGANDALMLRDAALGIAVIAGEGAAAAAVQAADVVVRSIGDALGLLLEPRRLIATLRH
ncbi:MAG TPA: HAD family hydrolase [Coriobacteriia bacterium]|nr:HAD family hydrolase [Coriobacteriia bacterium]